LTSRWFEWLLKKRVLPPSVHDRAIFYYGYATSLRFALGMKNQYAVYAFLFDSQSRARWVASGMATESDLELLFRMTKGLQQEERKLAASTARASPDQ